MQSVSADVSFRTIVLLTLSFSLVTSQWKTHLIRPKATPNEKNFKLLNKMAAQNRVTTAQDQYRFRQSHGDAVRL